ncbi:hypothetical protein [Sulfidibacter corallicola]|uniref:Uncharacterized protein n=1 Tax=Sulfidibacter corallicola TaxID=2818388 RepID=A0A8A4U2Q6_SULCO|nr:hypothetical protein [Sulfidibacter corallicola]QTD53015.1 hypothetical protein J3U87_11180 [Sulfidibacter corallicola]
MMNCGGGANDNPPDVSVNLVLDVNEIDDDGEFVEAEMIKDVASTRIVVDVSVAQSGAPVDPTVGVVNLERYTISFERTDGGSPNLQPVQGGLAQTIRAATIEPDPGAIPVEISEEMLVVSTDEKLFSNFAQAFRANPSPVIFDATLTVFGRTQGGDQISRSAGFKVQCAVFGETESLLPSITSFSQTEQVTVGNDYIASWSAFGGPLGISSGLLLTPWGQTLALGSNNFPVGGAAVSTGFLADRIPPGGSITFPTGVLFVTNFAGTSQSDSGDDVVISAGSTSDMQITQFFADRTEIFRGESINLNWAVTGGPDQLEVLPSSYSGVPVDFTGRDLSFDSVTITPEFSVRPLLRARRNDGAIDEAFVETAITVTSNEIGPPTIVHFSASRTLVPVGSQIVLFWDVSGQFTSIDLFPVNGNRVDVTDRESFLMPPINATGQQTYTLVARGIDGSVVASTVTVDYSENLNEQIEITNIVQEPNPTIENGDQGSFRFTVSDPERQDSSWRVRKIAGDQVTFFPTEGKIEDGLGDASVAFDDRPDNTNGYFTFEISAWDDDIFGFDRGSTRAVQLVSFLTTDQSANGPTITEGPTFIEGGDLADSTVPGTEGIIAFAFSDPDTPSLFWSVRIVAGDFGGSLTPSSGTVNSGNGDIAVRYVDDPDTPADPVVFEVRVEERGVAEPQVDIAILRHDKGTTGGGGVDPTPGTIALRFDGLFANLFGGVNNTDAINDFLLFLGDTGGDPRFFRNSDLSGPIDGISSIWDFSHETNNPGNIATVDYTRDFLPSGSVDNTGSMTRVGYFSNPGSTTAASDTPIDNGVSRWFFSFTVGSFGPNLPTAGATRTYQISADVEDQNDVTATFSRTLTIVAPNP